MANRIGFGEITCYAEHRLSELVSERMEKTGETQECAEIAVARTTEGERLWEASRQQSIKRSGGNGRAAPQKAGAEGEGAIGLGAVGGAHCQLSELVKARMKRTGEDQQCAEMNVIRTDAGRAAWEDMRRKALKR
jgi:hypothetical protein